MRTLARNLGGGNETAGWYRIVIGFMITVMIALWNSSDQSLKQGQTRLYDELRATRNDLRQEIVGVEQELKEDIGEVRQQLEDISARAGENSAVNRLQDLQLGTLRELLDQYNRDIFPTAPNQAPDPTRSGIDP